MAVRFEHISMRLIPVVTLGDQDTMVSLAGRKLDSCTGLILSNMPHQRVNSSNELDNPILIEFRDPEDIDNLINDLTKLKVMFNR